jgi:hypothetical protein
MSDYRCERYSKAWSFSFSPAKSKLLQFVKHSIGRNVILYNEPITEVSSAKHVGIVLDTSLKTMERTQNACHVCTTRAYDFSISQLTDIPKTSIKTGTTITRKETKPEKETEKL